MKENFVCIPKIYLKISGLNINIFINFRIKLKRVARKLSFKIFISFVLC